MGRRLDANDVFKQAEGEWINILSLLAGNELGDAVDNFTGKYKKSSRYFCPMHGGKSGEAFTLYKDAHLTGGGVCNSCGGYPDGAGLLMAIKGWDFRTCLEKVADALNIDDSTNSRPEFNRKKFVAPEPTEEELIEAKRLINKRDKIISECVSLQHKSALPARIYFSSRGLSEVGRLGGEVLFHPGLESWKDKKEGGFELEGVFPAIVAIIRNVKGEVKNIHRTFITNDGRKADLPSPRKMGAAILTDPVKGCSIQIMPPARIMGVAEGLETTLAVCEAYAGKVNIAMNSVINTSLMKCWEPPVGCEIVVIFADLDKSQAGQVAAQELYDRLTSMGILCFLALPEEEESLENVDWENVLNLYGVEGFPDLSTL